ncbi:hypothetical protein BK648_15655 [Pseudomonas poae]|uniref:Uncharacterized protein n=1 Tax=Pseudomonas poae TaxID=200451 RepID=A0A423EYD4_9PSED|nr:hypothetical protein [Pseudomonas poae]ROM46083.1 hypothetical protein BK648_15655 [Pseudomonas poae]
MHDLRPSVAEITTIVVDATVINKSTGEILGEYTKNEYVPTTDVYEIPQPTASSIQTRFQIDPAAYVVVGDFAPSALPVDVVDLDAVRAKRGPKPKVFLNVLAPFIQVAHAEEMQWLDDFVYGACYTSGETSNGTLNVSPSDVRRVCMLPVISTETVRSVIRTRSFEPVSERQARRIAKAAKFAVGGIHLYLSRNVKVMERLKYEVDFIDAYYGSDADEMSA